jgi:beta-lactamase superfamily II metal-dependent hydrolase
MVDDYGSPPSTNEIELTLFGPGYGEALAVHLGNERWLLVDSCVATGTKTPAAYDYLTQIGVCADRVKAIVASHWHDDHVRGLSNLVAYYPQAEFFFPAVFANREASAFLSAYSGRECKDLSRGTKELFSAWTSCDRPIAVKNRVQIMEDSSGNIPVRVCAYSPTEGAFADFLARIFQYIPRAGADLPIVHAPDISPNFTSIVVQVEFDDGALLLGADLEDHAELGWGAVLQDSWCRSRKVASLFKVAHHGSITGDNPDTWIHLVDCNPLAVLSPFNHGRCHLPTIEDKKRILSRTPNAYITSLSSRRPQMPADQLKRLGDICEDISISQSGFGAVRARREFGQSEWRVETFGSAARLA